MEPTGKLRVRDWNNSHLQALGIFGERVMGTEAADEDPA
jgi:hypothetical protein